MLHLENEKSNFKSRVNLALDLIKFHSVNIRMAVSVYALDFTDACNMYNYIKANF